MGDVRVVEALIAVLQAVDLDLILPVKALNAMEMDETHPRAAAPLPPTTNPNQGLVIQLLLFSCYFAKHYTR